MNLLYYFIYLLLFFLLIRTMVYNPINNKFFKSICPELIPLNNIYQLINNLFAYFLNSLFYTLK